MVVVVLVLAVVVVVDVVPEPPLDDPPEAGTVVVLLLLEEPAAMVVVVVGGATGATNGTVSPRMVAALVVGVTERPVQLRAAFQLVTAAVAGAPLSDWGTPFRMVAGRQTAPVI